MRLLQDKFDILKCCVLIPTYNNAAKLPAVLEDVLKYTDSVIVVNDGSTDNTADILSGYDQLTILNLQVNKGKGKAMLAGMTKAEDLGFDYAISIDSDGQHLAKDLHLFLDKLEEKPGVMLVGARNMTSEGIPGGSSFGHKFSNFWYNLETGNALPDTQSGFRLYPLKEINSRRFYTSRYEFEIESLVRLDWAGVEVDWVPIEVLYPEDRISHFRKFWDFFRISILNTVFVLISLLWIKPRDLYRSIKRGEVKKIIREQILRTQDSNRRMAIAIGFGIFMGIFPVWGFQMLIAVFLASFFRLNKIIVLAAANISIPPVIPVLLYFSFVMGGLILNQSSPLEFNPQFGFENIKNNLFQYYIGAVIFASLTGVISGFISYFLLIAFRKEIDKKPFAKEEVKV
jgi:glycosyltransferase involved in cell wall biosynthesis